MSANPASSNYPENGVPPNEEQKAAQQRTGSNVSETQDSSTEPEGGYPPQRHAGAVGLGPEYGQQNKVVSNTVFMLR
jgi:hypothetical protein